MHALIEHGLVDELRLMVFPVVLGSGKRLFPDDLADTTNSGVAVHTYHPAPT